MNRNPETPRRARMTLAALMLVAATASGCGVGLPTQPDLGDAAPAARTATATRAEGEAPIEMDDPTQPGGTITTPEAPAGETVVPSPTGNRGNNGLAKGHYKNKPKNR